jgi:hypothetical protein
MQFLADLGRRLRDLADSGTILQSDALSVAVRRNGLGVVWKLCTPLYESPSSGATTAPRPPATACRPLGGSGRSCWPSPPGRRRSTPSPGRSRSRRPGSTIAAPRCGTLPPWSSWSSAPTAIRSPARAAGRPPSSRPKPRSSDGQPDPRAERPPRHPVLLPRRPAALRSAWARSASGPPRRSAGTWSTSWPPGRRTPRSTPRQRRGWTGSATSCGAGLRPWGSATRSGRRRWGRGSTSYLAGRTDLTNANTRNGYRYAARHLAACLGADRDMRTIGPADADRWLVWAKTHLAPATVAQELMFARHFWRKAISAGVARSNPFEGLKGPEGRYPRAAALHRPRDGPPDPRRLPRLEVAPALRAGPVGRDADSQRAEAPHVGRRALRPAPRAGPGEDGSSLAPDVPRAARPPAGGVGPRPRRAGSRPAGRLHGLQWAQGPLRASHPPHAGPGAVAAIVAQPEGIPADGA